MSVVRHYSEIAHINLHAYYLQKVRSVKIPAYMEEGLMRPQPVAEEMSAYNMTWVNHIISLQQDLHYRVV